MLPVRNYGLDLLRILLCLTVVFFHYSCLLYTSDAADEL